MPVSTKAKVKKSFRIERRSELFLQAEMKKLGARSESHTLDCLLAELQVQRGNARRNLEVKSFYDHISDEEVASEQEWGCLAAEQLLRAAD